MIKAPTNEKDLDLKNSLLFDKNYWKGQGSIIILQTGATLHFTITNTFQKEAEGFIKMLQEVRLQEINETWVTHFEFCKFQGNQFEIYLNNDSAGKLCGDGYFNDSDVSWKVYDEKDRIIGKTQYVHTTQDIYLINSSFQFPGTTQISISGLISSS